MSPSTDMEAMVSFTRCICWNEGGVKGETRGGLLCFLLLPLIGLFLGDERGDGDGEGVEPLNSL
jgi:hypothetical protein